MARKFVKAVTLLVDDDTAYTAEVFKTSPGRYVTEFRKGAGKTLHKENAEHQSDAWAIRTATARLQQMARKGNPEKGPAGSTIQTQAEVNEFVRKMNETVLYAAPLGKTRGIKAWEKNEVFQAVAPPHWDGSPFFRSSDAERIYNMGYRTIRVVGGTGDGFTVELVMQ